MTFSLIFMIFALFVSLIYIMVEDWFWAVVWFGLAFLHFVDYGDMKILAEKCEAKQGQVVARICVDPKGIIPLDK